MIDPIADGVEAEYRAALSGSVPEAMNDARFGAAMAAACLVFAIIRVHRFPKLDARGAGVPGQTAGGIHPRGRGPSGCRPPLAAPSTRLGAGGGNGASPGLAGR